MAVACPRQPATAVNRIASPQRGRNLTVIPPKLTESPALQSQIPASGFWEILHPEPQVYDKVSRGLSALDANTVMRMYVDDADIALGGTASGNFVSITSGDILKYFEPTGKAFYSNTIRPEDLKLRGDVTAIFDEYRKQTQEALSFDKLSWDVTSWLNTVSFGQENQELIQKIDELRGLSDNWNGYRAAKIDPRIIDAAKNFIRSLPEPLVTMPQVVPMTRGRLQLEWHKGDRSLEIEITSPKSAHYLKWDPANSIEDEDIVPLTNLNRLHELVRWFSMGTVHA